MKRIKVKTRRKLERLRDALDMCLFYDDLNYGSLIPLLFQVYSELWCKRPSDLMYDRRSRL